MTALTMTPMPSSISDFITDFCKAVPDIMQGVLDREFGDLDSYFEVTEAKANDDNSVYIPSPIRTYTLVGLPKCGCLIGSVVLTIAEKKSCGLKQVTEKYKFDGGYLLEDVIHACALDDVIPKKWQEVGMLSAVGMAVSDWAREIDSVTADEDPEWPFSYDYSSSAAQRAVGDEIRSRIVQELNKQKA